MVSPLAIPRRNTRQSSTSTSHSQSLSTSLESKRVTEQPIIPSSPSTPHIMTASSSASFSSSSTSRPSLPRRGSSLPIPTQQRERMIQESSSTCGSENFMSMLQFISSTSTPSWAEVEASNFAEVPTNFPPILHDNVDMVTFLREAPGVNRTPQTKLRALELDLQENIYPWTQDIGDCTENAQVEEEDVEGEGQVVTPELGSSATVNEAKGNELSLQAFLEEQAMEDGLEMGMGMDGIAIGSNSPNPSVIGAGEIYGGSSNPNLSSYGLNLDMDANQVTREKASSPYAYENGSTCTLEDTLRSGSSCYNDNEKATTTSSFAKAKGMSLSTRSRIVSAPSPVLGSCQNLRIQSHIRGVTTEQAIGDAEARKRGGVGRVMRLAKEALGIRRA
ncbi:hypothetical protein IAT40_004916 [Kwoniella sp. CBS 6097]